MRCWGGWRARRAVIIACLACAAVSVTGCRQIFGRQYEYEEDITLAVDGSATININASLASLAVLRGLALDWNPRVKFEPAQVRSAFEAAGCVVTRVSSTPWIRNGRRFVQVRLDLPDVREAGKCGALAWSTYGFSEEGGVVVYRQTVGMPANGSAAGVNWNGGEVVGFKLHLPSKITFHNVRDIETGAEGKAERGNILTWEQWLKDRRIGTPLVMEMKMERESILYRTLWLFAGALVTALVVIGGLIAWTIRRGRTSRSA